jgi:hypothetical protein
MHGPQKRVASADFLSLSNRKSQQDRDEDSAFQRLHSGLSMESISRS